MMAKTADLLLQQDDLSLDPVVRWQRQNERYLAAQLLWLRQGLERLGAGQEPGEVARSTPEPDMAAADTPPALVWLSRVLGLTRFEQNVLLLAAAPELDSQMARLSARAQDSPNQSYPTLALAMALFERPEWDALSPERPLRYWRLIEFEQIAGQALTASPIHADERIVSYLKGLNYLDSRLSSLFVRLDLPHDAAPLPRSQGAVVDRMVTAASRPEAAVIQLVGRDLESHRYVAQHAAARLGWELYRMPAALLPSNSADLEQFLRLFERESALLPLALLVEALDLDEAAAPAVASALTRLVERPGGPVVLAGRSPWRRLPPQALVLDVARPLQAEQLAYWQALLARGNEQSGAADNQSAASAALLAGQFDLSLPAIGHIFQRVEAGLNPIPGPEDVEAKKKQVAENGATGSTVEQERHHQLWDESRRFTRPRLEKLAQRLEATATWEDIVLPPRQLHLLSQIANQVRQRTRVYETWDFRRKMNRGFGINVLFSGDSGTGKTMAAEVIANELQLDLYLIDLSAVVNKYIGETEKNLRRLFDAAEDGGAILFFDEADALFGKRSEVKDSHDRYANIEINYLLQRMEAYSGLAILATNMKSTLDSAFLRRLRFIVDFPFPGVDERRAIWERSFPPGLPGAADLDFGRLARFTLSGGSIRVISLNAAFAAAAAGGKLTMPVVLDAIETELEKLEMPLNRALLRWPDGS